MYGIEYSFITEICTSFAEVSFKTFCPLKVALDFVDELKDCVDFG